MLTAPATAADVHVGVPAQVETMLITPGVVRHGHFELLSGQHSDRFLAFSALAADKATLETLGDWLAPVMAAWRPDVVLAPSTAGVSLGGACAMRVGARLDLADVDGRGRPMGVIGTSVLAGARVALVNDVVTTGAGMRLLAELTRAAGAEVVGGAWFASRAPVDVASMLSAPTVHVSDLLLAATESDACAQCLDSVPLQLAVDLN